MIAALAAFLYPQPLEPVAVLFYRFLLIICLKDTSPNFYCSIWPCLPISNPVNRCGQSPHSEWHDSIRRFITKTKRSCLTIPPSTLVLSAKRYHSVVVHPLNLPRLRRGGYPPSTQYPGGFALQGFIHQLEKAVLLTHTVVCTLFICSLNRFFPVRE